MPDADSRSVSKIEVGARRAGRQRSGLVSVLGAGGHAAGTSSLSSFLRPRPWLRAVAPPGWIRPQGARHPGSSATAEPWAEEEALETDRFLEWQGQGWREIPWKGEALASQRPWVLGAFP